MHWLGVNSRILMQLLIRYYWCVFLDDSSGGSNIRAEGCILLETLQKYDNLSFQWYVKMPAILVHYGPGD